MSERPLRLFAWNILHGGGPRRTPEIALAILAHAPDLVVLSEFRAGRGGQIRAMLADAGLHHQIATDSPPTKNGMLVASRSPLEPCPPRASLPGSRGRFIECLVPELGFRLAGVHVPDDTDLVAKQRYWHFLITYARAHADEPCLVVGDFNMGRRGQDDNGRGFACESLLGTFTSLGFCDAWRHHHPEERLFTWFHHDGSGARIDAAYATISLLPRVQSVEYSTLERDQALSDHAAIVLDLVCEDTPSNEASRRANHARGGLFGGENR